MSEPLAPVVMIDADELERLRINDARYQWLRERAIRVNGSEMWWSGDYLDTRVDTGLAHVDEPLTAEPVKAKRHRLPKPDPKLK